MDMNLQPKLFLSTPRQFLILFFVFLLPQSCAVEELRYSESPASERASAIEAKSFISGYDSRKDSLLKVNEAQTNKTYFLLSLLKLIDGVYVLALPESKILSFGISKNEYDRFMGELEQLNQASICNVETE